MRALLNLLFSLGTQAFLFHYKNLYYVLFLFIGLSFLANGSLASKPLFSGEFSRNYSSYTGGLDRYLYSKPKVYNFYQLLNLRKALRPRLIRVFKQKKYSFRSNTIQRGILFSYEGPSSSSELVKKVSLSGNFNNWSEIAMKRNSMGIFFYVLSVDTDSDALERELYRYKFVVDGVWQHDPKNPYRVEDQMGGYYSLFYLDEKPINPLASVRVHEIGEKYKRSYWVEFSAYLPQVRNLVLVGNFNNWNPEHDPMQSNGRGLFQRKIKLEPGEYIYKFIADGKWVLDKYNSETRFDSNIQELASFVKVP